MARSAGAVLLLSIDHGNWLVLMCACVGMYAIVVDIPRFIGLGVLCGQAHLAVAGGELIRACTSGRLERRG